MSGAALCGQAAGQLHDHDGAAYAVVRVEVTRLGDAGEKSTLISDAAAMGMGSGQIASAACTLVLMALNAVRACPCGTPQCAERLEKLTNAYAAFGPDAIREDQPGAQH